MRLFILFVLFTCLADRLALAQVPEPVPYLAEDVAYPNTAAPGVQLAGTLTKPPGQGPWPAILLITGSGPQNRDEEILGHRPFWVLADALTRLGFAVLRVDDRGTGQSTGSFRNATTLDFITDGAASIRYLQARSDIDAGRIGLIGHSEGAVIAAVLAAQLPRISFVILLAGPGIPGDQLIEEQNYRIQIAAGIPPDRAAEERKILHQILAIIMAVPYTPEAERQIMLLVARSGKSPQELRALQQELELRMLSPWFRGFLLFDSRTVLRKLQCPVLALNGSKDLQVVPDLNLAGIRQALAEGGNQRATIEEIPGLNHLFQTAATGLPSEYATLPEDFSVRALDIIRRWLLHLELQKTTAASLPGRQ